MTSFNWVEKLKIEVTEEEKDGGCILSIYWDSDDPDFEYWINLGEEGQKSFIIKALTNAAAMTIDTYGLDEDRYLKLFEEKATFVFKTMRALISAAQKENVNLSGWPHDVIWKMYESIAYDVNDEARVIQKTEDPEKIAERSYEPITVFTRQDLMDEIKSVKELLTKPG